MLAEAKTLTMAVEHPKEAPPDGWFTLHGEPVGVSSTSWERPMLAGLQNQRHPPPKRPTEDMVSTNQWPGCQVGACVAVITDKEAGYTFSGSYEDCAAGSLSAL